MYRKKDDLQLLIDTMSAIEKKHFLRYCSFNSKKENPLYLQLFEHLEQGAKPDVRNTSVQALTITKRDLYKNILKSLSSFHSDKEEGPGGTFSEAEILYNKNLPEQSLRALAKAKKEASKQENFGQLLQLLELERKLSAVIDAPPRTMTEIANDEQEVADRLNNILTLERMYSKAIEYKRKYGYVRGSARSKLYEEIIDQSILATESNCLSQKARYYYFLTKAITYFILYEYKLSYEYGKKSLELNRKIIPLHEYINGILHHTSSCICSGLFGETLSNLELVQSLIDERQLDLFNILALKVFYYRSNYELICYLYMGEADKTKKKILEIEESLIRFQDRIPLEMRQVINCGLRNGYLSLGEEKGVNRIIDSMLSKEVKLIRSDIYDDLLLFRLIWLIQEKSYEILPSIALSTYRYYANYDEEDNRYDIEIKVCRLLMKTIDYTNRDFLIFLLAQLNNIFNEHIAQVSPVHKFLEHYSYYQIWLQSLIKGIVFTESAKEWASIYKKEQDFKKQ